MCNVCVGVCAGVCVCVRFCVGIWRTENQTNNTQTCIKIQPKIIPKFVKNRSKIQPKSAKNRSQIDPKSVLEPISLPTPLSVRFWSHFGSNLGPSWGPSSGHVGQEIDFWKFLKPCKNDNDFQHLSGPSWDRFWNDFGVQNRAKIGPRSVSRAIMKQMQRSSKSSAGAVFLRIRRFEKRSKSNNKSS